MTAAAMVERLLMQRAGSVPTAGAVAIDGPIEHAAPGACTLPDAADPEPDREFDDRRACLECAYLAGNQTAWRCLNWRKAHTAPQLPGALVTLLQRCDGFRAALSG